MPSDAATAQFFDSHLHLEPGDEATPVLEAARDAGVTRFLIAGTDEPISAHVAELAAAHQGVYAAVGIHPHEAAAFSGDPSPFRAWCDEPRVVAVGEVGLDYHYNHSPGDVQRRVFARFLALAVETDLPVIVHCREAYDDCIRILSDELPAGHPFEIHSFTGTPEQAQDVLSMGGVLSFNGMLTFRRADTIREAFAVVPIERVLLETDSPWLAPVPYRGHRNQPAYVVDVARKVAELRQLPLDRVADITTDNACRFFRIPPP